MRSDASSGLRSPLDAESGAHCRDTDRRTALIAEGPVRYDERAAAKLEAAAARAERTGIDGVVPDRVEEVMSSPRMGRALRSVALARRT
jgi:hypothetical protein